MSKTSSSHVNVHRSSSSWRPGRAALAGLAATAAYSVVMESDMSITGNHFNDVRFIEGLLPELPGVPAKTARPLLAWAIHLLNDVLLGELYGAIFKRLARHLVFGKTLGLLYRDKP